ncbi:STAS domain-containing protein [Rhabdothermincola salaria]|uniref:STAS domain-containing protein n=1 Tax=Rhabdothermincola salaria TaxID=2903142 RepID=UPI001E45FA71|nr:STAS domain-containing protein [Rhabdothermincola salaria]
MSADLDQPLKIVVSSEGDTVVVSLTGELDPHTVPMLADELDDAIDGGATSVALDLSGLTFIDSSGLRVVIATHRRLEESGGRLVLRAPSDTVRRLLELTGLLGHIDIV